MFLGLSDQRGWEMLQGQMHLNVSETLGPQQGWGGEIAQGSACCEGIRS